ncbi:hypothetical protein ONS95_003379 [Cadophora gregata]|uniref:uncharacterized protein n=1 Tax=Cadophora gregata TaxID=51156 RepID=UPI0026DD3671|nr:uncharacterized protein ONS95_003379 [Cadophora gregata]KAK0108582.1 hypothetical protein ONS95_003379 [Cadophora gregata]KAK0108825.1 hypothetical protein ONS96_002667 [Cadophora gregata f. sp. sojae]
MASGAARRSAPSTGSTKKQDPAKVQLVTAVQDASVEAEQDAGASGSSSKLKEMAVVTTRSIDEPTDPSHVEEPRRIILPDESTAWMSKIHLLDLPVELVDMFCRVYLDVCSNTCLGLTCRTLFNMTEHIHPYQVSLHMRTSGKCLGHLLTGWMAPKYSFDHAWGKFLPKKMFLRNDEAIEREWRRKESWRNIRLAVDNAGAIVAYESSSKRKGF